MQFNSQHHSVASGAANSDKMHQATEDWRRSLIQLSRPDFGLGCSRRCFLCNAVIRSVCLAVLLCQCYLLASRAALRLPFVL